jgi:hypothetical protein
MVMTMSTGLQSEVCLVPTVRRGGEPVRLVAAEPEPVQARERRRPASVDPSVLSQLSQISERYSLCREQVDVLRLQGPYADAAAERAWRAAIVQKLHLLHELRERRNAVLEAYDLSSGVGSSASS